VSKAHTNNFAIFNVLIFATLLILTSSLIFTSFTDTAKGQYPKPPQCLYTIPDGHCDYMELGGYATLNINTNIYADSECGGSHKTCPDNKDMIFRLQSSQRLPGWVVFYKDTSDIRGSPDTITLKVPVAAKGKSDYSFKLANNFISTKVPLGYWAPGDESVKQCSGQLSVGDTATCTVSINWGWYSLT
jgi:hypothetical protein